MTTPAEFAQPLRDARETGILSLKDRGLKVLPSFLKIEELSDLTEIGENISFFPCLLFFSLSTHPPIFCICFANGPFNFM